MLHQILVLQSRVIQQEITSTSGHSLEVRSSRERTQPLSVEDSNITIVHHATEDQHRPNLRVRGPTIIMAMKVVVEDASKSLRQP